MDEQILHALCTGEGQMSQPRLLQYFEHLKNTDHGWQVSGDALAQNIYSDDRIKFFCLQVLEHQVKIRYPAFAEEHKQALQAYLFQWMKHCSTQDQKPFVRNKTAQIFCLLFIQEYPAKWTSFFHDIIGFLNLGTQAVDMYLRILLAVDEEVVAKHIPHTPVEVDRNTLIKDRMREDCIPELVDSWYQLLKLYEETDPSLTCMCMQVIGLYVSWIDIDLIANDKFVSTLLSYLSVDVLRESACDCFLQIISKGMEPIAKTKLVQSLAEVLEKVGVLRSDKEDDFDFIAKLAKLVNGMGLELIYSWTKLSKASNKNEESAKILGAIETKLPYLFSFLGHEDDDISESVCEFAHAYIGLLKLLPKMSPKQEKTLQDLLHTIFKKLKYDEDYDFDQEGEDEAMFVEYRKQMKILLSNIAKIDAQLVVRSIQSYLKAALSNWEKASFMDVELGIYLLYLLGEAVQGQVLYTDEVKFSALQDMMSTLITSNVSFYEHPSVKLQYFETVTRYERFFFSQTQHIPAVLASFLDERGIRNTNGTVRSRGCYLMLRFVKSLKNQIHPYSEDILKRFQALLVTAGENGSEHRKQLTENDLNYLYEVATILITCCGSTNTEKQLSQIKSLLSPVIQKFGTILEKMQTTQMDELTLFKNATELNSLTGFTSRASKAFTSQLALKQSGCMSCFTEALTIFVQSLTIPVHREIIHSGVRQYLHRMIICLGEDLLPFLPIAVTHLLKDCEIRDIQEFIPLINQLIARFKGLISPFLCEVFMPLVNTIFSILNAPLDQADLQAVRERQTLRRSYFLFISTIVNNNVLEVFNSQNSADSKQILLTIIQGASEIPDPQGQKTCFNIFNKLIEIWGSENGLNGFKDFIYENIIPACVIAPLKLTFDLSDAQTILVLQEIAQVQKTIVSKTGLEIIQHIQNTYLPQLSCPPDAIREYCHALQHMEIKSFKSFLKQFYSRWKT